MEKISKIYKKIISGKIISTKESFEIFDAMLDNRLSIQEISAVLTVLSFRGENHQEIIGVSKVLVQRSKKINLGKIGIIDLITRANSVFWVSLRLLREQSHKRRIPPCHRPFFNLTFF